MTSLFVNDRIPFPKDEVLTQSFLIDKIASNMRMKYKKVFSVINYDEISLKSDIHQLLSKYISNKHKEINIRYIETTILNKIRDKYKYKKFKSPAQNKNKNLIRIVNSSPNKSQSYLDIVNHKTNLTEKNIKLPAIDNKPMTQSTEINRQINNNKYYTLEQNNGNNNISNNIKISNNNEEESIYNINSKNKINNEINEIKNKVNELQNDDGSIKKDIEKEQEEINQLEKYRLDIQNQIDEMNKEIEREKSLYLKNENNNINKNYKNKNYQLDKDKYNNSYNNNINSYNSKLKNDYNWNYNPSISLEQMQYLERKKRIEEDYQNKQNRYMFVKPRHYKNEEEEESNLKNNSHDNSNTFRYDNIRINRYSMDKLNEFNKIKEKIKQEKELRYKNNKSTSNIIDDHDDEYRPREIEKSIPYEDKIQMKILKRSMEQEKAIEHLKKILYPEKQFLAEKEYQGFNKALNERDMMKKREIELADKARRIQIEKMKKSLDYTIDSKKRRKNAEKKIEQKYREMLDKDYELFLEKEKKEKYDKAEKMENYRKMLDEQIEQKNQLMMEEENLSEKNVDFDLVEN